MSSKPFVRLLCAAVTIAAVPTQAAQYILPPEDVPIIGRIQRYTTVHSDTLADIARLYGVGHDEIVAANKGVDVWLPGENVEVVVPTRFILPDAGRTGIVVNLPEMRLYHYGVDTHGLPVVTTHPVSVGRMDWSTPLGQSSVVAKATDPAWYPPKSIRAEHEADGDPLPMVVPAGPDNPLGRHMLRLGIPGYLIHGTNRPYGVGMRVTHGCLRMYPEDIEWLYDEVSVSTPVTLLNQPVKLARLGDRFFVEVHAGLEEQPISAQDTLAVVLQMIEARVGKSGLDLIDQDKLLLMIEKASGMPVAVPLQERTAEDTEDGSDELA
ncbi:MAG: L,D-transpeptidase family protein [Granulosicoccaceae bacterium]